jgi:hypothetical protein
VIVIIPDYESATFSWFLQPVDEVLTTTRAVFNTWRFDLTARHTHVRLETAHASLA